MPQRITTKQKAEVAKRARNLCEYCRSPASHAIQAFSVEHINPRQKGGGDQPENLALACQGCNSHKHTKVTGIDPLTNMRVRLYHPRLHRWRDHFRWNNDFTRIIGLTSIGRTTVATLYLNREGLMNFRAALHAINKHPPEEADDGGQPEP